MIYRDIYIYRYMDIQTYIDIHRYTERERDIYIYIYYYLYLFLKPLETTESAFVGWLTMRILGPMPLLHFVPLLRCPEISRE